MAEAWPLYRASGAFTGLAATTLKTYDGAWQNYVGPTLGDRPISGLTPADLLNTYDTWTEDRTCRFGIARIGIILLENLRKFAQLRVYVQADWQWPTKYLNDEVPGWRATKVRIADVPNGLLPALWRETHAGDNVQNMDRVRMRHGAAIRFAILTGLRKTEICRLTWSEVDLRSRTLHLPAERVKTKRPLTLPLAEPAIGILRQMRYRNAWSEYRSNFVFGRLEAQSRRGVKELMFPPPRRAPHVITGGVPLPDPNLSLVGIGQRIGKPDRLTMHVLRKLFAQIAEDTVGFRATKMLLNHAASGDVTERNYLMRDVERLRPKAEAVGARVLELVGDAYQRPPINDQPEFLRDFPEKTASEG